MEISGVEGPCAFELMKGCFGPEDTQPGSTLTPESSMRGCKSQSQDGLTGGTNVGKPSDTLIPSLEHGRYLYPRPRPTFLSQSSPSTSKKGKERARVDSDVEYVPEEDDMFDKQDVESNGDGNEETKGVGSDMEFESEKPDKEASGTGFFKKPSTKSWMEMRGLLLKANKRIDVLESELKSLTKVVRKSLGSTGEVDAQAKPGGGRTAVSSAHLS
ncbi:uncharacterized protein MELLADRAFT_114263 [Melampsora larici-populina 98AG31]|uniref:Uncharacterized protein n=1 Tax=Melampsora larici-populina (strain 98AG31 / pathotype 3-4-7) TaxID=747676 RepID=F4SCU5_MELLP|nr:uncharacterized protein MELLADRAFT_114263 [Melampsora larici-populina 98AG31]EGF97534.1 hypothetical protein MELLADRAFT_114263 [Melampsora larici-populina 98AG31]